MKKILFILLTILLFSCEIIPEQEKVNVYFCGGQSNANKVWYESIKAEIFKIDPEAIVIHKNHPGESIVYWWDEDPRESYIEDIGFILPQLKGVDFDFKGLFWFQGEADRYRSEYYEYRFMNMISQFKLDLSDNDFDIFMNIVGTLEDAVVFEDIRSVQFKMSDDNSYIYGIDTERFERLSPITSHMPDYCYTEIGKELAHKAIEIIY